MSAFEIPEAERVDPQSLIELRARNQTYLETQYSRQVAELRANVTRRLIGHSALHGKIGWAIYQEQPPQQSGVLVDDCSTETLVMVLIADEEEQVGSHIRIVTNTEYRHNAATAYLTEDVTVDSEDDAQMFIDTVFIDESANILPSREPQLDTLSPLFFVKDGEIKFTNMRSFTPSLPVTCAIGDGTTMREATVLPFGTYENYEDKVAALEKARDIFRATERAELVARYTP